MIVAIPTAAMIEPTNTTTSAVRFDNPVRASSSAIELKAKQIAATAVMRAGLDPNEMGLRPQTLYGLADSPVGLAAWMIDHDARSEEMIVRVFDGGSEGLSRDDILDNITLYWLTNTAVSSARLYYSTRQMGGKGGFFDARGVQLPVAVMAYPDEIYQAPQSWAERAYPKLLRYNRLPKGGHFAAWEQPETFVTELRAGFNSLRSA